MSKEYILVQEEIAIDDVFPHHDDDSLGFGKKRQISQAILPITLSLSLAANALFIILHILQKPHEFSSPRTAFAGLERNEQIAWSDDSDFASHNRTIWDQAWDTLNPDTGFVAISDDFTMRTGLHKSQRWPWDPSKGLYLLQGYHNLHCLIMLRTSLTEMHDKEPQSLHFTHINHCLDALRQEIMCNADDTPRYSGLGQRGGTGNGQYRMCRDWRKLEEWANGQSPCYRYKAGVETLEGGIPQYIFPLHKCTMLRQDPILNKTDPFIHPQPVNPYLTAPLHPKAPLHYSFALSFPFHVSKTLVSEIKKKPTRSAQDIHTPLIGTVRIQRARRIQTIPFPIP